MLKRIKPIEVNHIIDIPKLHIMVISNMIKMHKMKENE